MKTATAAHVGEMKALVQSGDLVLADERAKLTKEQNEKLSDDQLIIVIAATDDDDNDLLRENADAMIKGELTVV